MVDATFPPCFLIFFLPVFSSSPCSIVSGKDHNDDEGKELEAKRGDEKHDGAGMGKGNGVKRERRAGNEDGEEPVEGEVEAKLALKKSQ
jgi:hypothetical protein